MTPAGMVLDGSHELGDGARQSVVGRIFDLCRTEENLSHCNHEIPLDWS